MTLLPGPLGGVDFSHAREATWRKLRHRDPPAFAHRIWYSISKPARFPRWFADKARAFLFK